MCLVKWLVTLYGTNVDSVGEKKNIVENFRKKCWESGVSMFSKGLILISDKYGIF